MENEKQLRVYVDEGTSTYYIDVFAAFELGLIDYKTACNYYNTGRKYFKIDKYLLGKLSKIYKIIFVRIRLNNNKFELIDIIKESNKMFGDTIKKDYEIKKYDPKFTDDEEFESNRNL